MDSTSTERWISVSVFFLVLVVYCSTLYPSVPGGDSGEFIASAFTLGVAHPPGYPLFTMLGKFFTLLPWGSIAWRVNLLSALFGAGAAFFLHMSVWRWSRNIWAGITAAGLFAFSSLTWRWSVAAEVFALNNFFIALLLYLSVRYWQSRELNVVRLAAFFFGLGMANHHLLALYGIPLSLWILWTGRTQLLKPKEFAFLIGFFVLGLLPYLYLPFAGAREGVMTWGDVSSWDGFWNHFFRRDYGTFNLGGRGESAGLGSSFVIYIKDSAADLLWVGFPIALFGIWTSLKKEGRGGFAAITLVAFLCYLVVFHSRANLQVNQLIFHTVTTRFWQQSNLLICAWAGIGSAILFARVPAAALLIVVLQLGLHFRESDQHQNDYVKRYATNALGSLPQGALVLTAGDLETYAFHYLQECEGFRRDVRVIDRAMLWYPWMKKLVEKNYPEIVIPGAYYQYHVGESGGYTLAQLASANSGKQIYLSDFTEDEDHVLALSQLQVFVYGFLNHVLSPGEKFDLNSEIKAHQHALEGFDPTLPKETSTLSWEYFIWKKKVSDGDYRLAMAILPYALNPDTANPIEPLKLAASLMEKRSQAEDVNPVVLKNLGLAYSHLAQYEPTAKNKMIAVWKRYLGVAPAGDSQTAAISRAVSRAEAQH